MTWSTYMESIYDMEYMDKVKYMKDTGTLSKWSSWMTRSTWSTGRTWSLWSTGGRWQEWKTFETVKNKQIYDLARFKHEPLRINSHSNHANNSASNCQVVLKKEENTTVNIQLRNTNNVTSIGRDTGESRFRYIHEMRWSIGIIIFILLFIALRLIVTKGTKYL